MSAITNRTYSESTGSKVLSATPVIGPICALVNYCMLKSEISKGIQEGTPDSLSRSITLLKSQKHHAIAGLVSTILTIAAVIALLALILFNPALGIAVTAIAGALMIGAFTAMICESHARINDCKQLLKNVHKRNELIAQEA
jgi:hypothetical protein